ncbi:Restriction endonuclease [Tumidithrix helvetica PCC 7403]|uniref:hypothetical protein n=1 Tax=Tumidithrix helvetica TaxID=3457545 RepID=UPI003C86F87C
MADKPSSISIKEKPKICAIDLEEEIVEALKDKGLDCFSGTLGSQVKVPNLSTHTSHQCLLNYKLPLNLHEYDIIIVDLKDQEPIEYVQSQHTQSLVKGHEQPVFISKYPETIFDPRPISSHLLGKNLKDFISKETLIIVFCSDNQFFDYHVAKNTFRGLHEVGSERLFLYAFISYLQEIIGDKTDKNVVLSDYREDIKGFLHKYREKFIYNAVFQHPTFWDPKERKHFKRNNFVPLLLNSQSEIVGFIDFEFEPSTVIAFPQLQNSKKDFLLELINELLPSLFPDIFPYSEKFSWVKSEGYYLPNQEALLKEKRKIEDEHKVALARIDDKIQNNQVKYQYLHDLITKTADSLVKSVENFFNWLGFKNIVNLDETNPRIKEEDLQIPIENGLFVVEIKGIGGKSKDEDCSQVYKYKNRRIKELGRFDVFALYLVNHQRYLPPDKRNNPPFSDQQIADAEQEERGLLTTYELFKLYFNIEKGFITKEDARSSLLKCGLVQFKPSKARLLSRPYEILYGGKIVILNIVNTLLKVGSSIIVCNKDNWFKTEILTIRLNDNDVDSIQNGEIGIRLSKEVHKESELWLEDTTNDLS